VQADNLSGFKTKEVKKSWKIYKGKEHVATMSKDDGNWSLHSDKSGKELKSIFKLK